VCVCFFFPPGQAPLFTSVFMFYNKGEQSFIYATRLSALRLARRILLAAYFLAAASRNAHLFIYVSLFHQSCKPTTAIWKMLTSTHKIHFHAENPPPNLHWMLYNEVLH